MEIDQLIGKKIKELRLRYKISQEELGRKCGVSFQQIQKYEKGTNKISFNRLVDIAKTLNVSIEYFVNNNLTPTNSNYENRFILNDAQSGFDIPIQINNKNDHELLVIFRKLKELEDEKLKIKIIKIIKALID